MSWLDLFNACNPPRHRLPTKMIAAGGKVSSTAGWECSLRITYMPLARYAVTLLRSVLTPFQVLLVADDSAGNYDAGAAQGYSQCRVRTQSQLPQQQA